MSGEPVEEGTTISCCHESMDHPCMYSSTLPKPLKGILKNPVNYSTLPTKETCGCGWRDKLIHKSAIRDVNSECRCQPISRMLQPSLVANGMCEPEERLSRNEVLETVESSV